jgi:putative peptide zinc metalloprotease protein
VPGAATELPSAVLGSGGGGSFALDPRDSRGVRTLNRVFQVELELPAGQYARYLGARVFVRFDHGYEPMGLQAYRALRRLLLRHFDV